MFMCVHCMCVGVFSMEWRGDDDRESRATLLYYIYIVYICVYLYNTWPRICASNANCWCCLCRGNKKKTTQTKRRIRRSDALLLPNRRECVVFGEQRGGFSCGFFLLLEFLKGLQFQNRLGPTMFDAVYDMIGKDMGKMRVFVWNIKAK